MIYYYGYAITNYEYRYIYNVMKELDEDSDCPHKDLKIDVAWRENENIKTIDCNKKIEKELFKKENKK